MMQLAAIDIGTNSLHMIVVRIRPDLSFEVIDREKEMVRLGAGGLDGRSLTREAMHTALQVLSKFRRLAESHRVDEIVAVATSAVREADNGGEFLRAIQQETGIRARVIAGTEEARLIHLAAAYGVGVPGETMVVVDIGGGSVEITRGAGPTIDMGQSFKLGVIRLTERFIKSDPLAPRDERKLVKHVEAGLGGYLDQVVAAGFDRLVGTSGTILSLGAVALAQHGRPAGAALRNQRVAAKQIHRARKELVDLDLQRRLRVPGLEPRRADIAVAGALLLDTIIRRLDAQEITLCDLSLREGLVLDYIERHRKQIVQAERYPDVRRRSVVELAERCNYWPDHAHQVARLALSLFEQTRGVHALTDHEREWLEYAALLHDIGVHISYEGHHKHSYYLIRNGDLRGFDPTEIEILGAHRPLSPAGHAQAPAGRVCAAVQGRAGGWSGRSRPSCAWPRASIAATPRPSRASSCTTVARTDCSSSAPREMPNWSSGPPHDMPRPSSACSESRSDSKSAETPMLNNLTKPHEYPGKLFVVEGIDGSGKTTQLSLLAKWLTAEGHRVFVTEWNSSVLVKAATKTGKKKNALTPMTFSLLHATDFADRLLYKIIPPLKAGMIVLADRYAYTAFARDSVRGVDRQWVRELYSFAVRPDLALYFRVPIEVSLDRLLARRVKLKFYEAGMDLGWSANPTESFRLFQGKVLDEYDRLVEEFGLEVIDAARSITVQQQEVRKLIASQVQVSTVESTDEQLV